MDVIINNNKINKGDANCIPFVLNAYKTMNNIYINDEQSLYKQYQQFVNNIDYYSNLEKELQSLTDDEVNELINFQPYIDSNNALNMLVQAELLNLVRTKINSNPDTINKVVDSIKLFKSNKNKEQQEFQEYIRHYSDMTYKDYLRLKQQQNESK